ncbi:TPA: YopX family protein [Enterococcus faecium]
MIPKFRAWDKKTETIQEVESISFKEKKLVIEQQSIAWFNADYIRNFDDIELMQSTGLKDKNGVEIFEGDIVLADGVKKIVTFGEQEHEEDFGDLIYYIGFNVYTKMGYSSVIHVEYEVIGNIWENSELLEEQR